MAQAMLLMHGISTNTLDLNRNALLKLQIQKIKPKSSSSLLFFSPLPSSSSSALRTLALFKPKTKAPAKKVPFLCFFLFFTFDVDASILLV